MKKITILLVLICSYSFAQKKEVLYKKVASLTCECTTAKKTDKLSDEDFGFCILISLNKLTPKEQKIIGYDSNEKSEIKDEIAENIGIEMALICPEIFSKIESEVQVEEVPDLVFIGIFDTTVSNEFNTIKVTYENKVTKDFIWLFPFDGDSLLIKKKIVKGDKIEIRYREQSFFDPKTNDYKNYLEILEIKLL
ncbi:hypothetical protein [Flavobacterium sp.]|uniref:hypothetical protein n=1 Tax=Flavobacterium sp. TaxID=239 RepID=UPI0037522BB1